MRAAVALIALTVLAGCGGFDERATFACPNGPDLGVTYTEDSATLLINDGRTLVLPKVEENLYAAPGVVWQATAFRTARLTDGDRSYTCDQSSL